MGRLSYSTISRLRENSSLTEYPQAAQTYGRKIAVVGIATRGCRIAYELSQQCKQLGNFLYLSCDEEDVMSIPSSGKKIIFQVSSASERNPARIRGIVALQLDQVRTALSGSELVLIISGLGGTVGSAIAPLVAKCTKKIHAMTVGIVVMPFSFEKHRYFFAGCALRQLTGICDGIVLLENEMTLADAGLPAMDANARLYEKLSLVINSLVKPIEQDGLGTGIERMVDYIRANPYSMLQVTEGPATTLASGESRTPSGILVGYQSRKDVDEIIDSFDPVDACLRKSNLDNLDPDFDSSFEVGQGILRNIET